MKTTTLPTGIICIATLIQCIHSYAAVPAGYRGIPFDDAAYREEQRALADKKKPLPSDFIPAQVVFDSKTAVVGSGWVAHGKPTSSIALGEKDAEGKQVIRYLSKRPAYECFGWKWAKAEEPAVDLTKFDAVSFAIKVSGPHAADQMFFTITEFNPYPVSLRDYDPKFDDGAWHTITIPLADLKWTLAGKVTDRTEVRGFTFMAYTWRKRGSDYEVDLDHFALCHSAKPHETAAMSPLPVVPTTTGQVIPGRLECAFYDLGGEGVAYHDTEPINVLSGVLNQEKNHQRPASTPYYWNFRKDEGVDISYTKDFADLNHPNVFDPPVNQLYIGAANDGEWCNYTVNVKKPGKYKVIALYGFGANVIKFSINNVPASVCKLPVDTGSFHKWNKAEVGCIEFKKAGPQLLTFFYSRNNYAYFDFEPMDAETTTGSPSFAQAVAGTGIPSLDEMAGDWIPMQNVANPPAVHNFNQMLVVGRGLTSCYCNPGGLFTHTKDPGVQWTAGYPLVKISFNGSEYPATETRWYAYRALRRNPACNGVAVETDTRMVNEQRGVLCRITAANNTQQPQTTKLTLQVPGALQADGVGVSNSTQRKNVVSVVRPSRKPDSVTTEKDIVCWNWAVALPPGGKVTLGFVAGDETASLAAETDARVAAWARHFEAVMDECKRVWEQRWADAFTPGNTHFSGNLPVLKTGDAALARNYYMGALTMLVLERTQFPVSPRSFITSGERGDGIQYYWDASMQATAWALLEPVGMKATMRRWLVQNARSGAHTSVTASHGYDAAHYDKITGYAFNACTIFKAADEYLRVTGNRAFLDEKLEDGKTVLDHLDAFATDRETLPKGPHGLVDYGKNGNLLECAPAYIHCVPSLNSQAVWMMRRAAQWHALHGDITRSKELQNKAAAFLPAVLGLYKKGKGIWNAYHMDGTLVELRHCVDFIYVGNALQSDLTPVQRAEMNAFVTRELFMRDWMRAMSLQDAAAAHSNRPDHSPTGAYDGWIPLTVGTMWQLGDPVTAYEFYCRTVIVTKEGPFAQAREFYGPNKKEYDAPVRVAMRGGCMKECISGAAFADVVLNTFFGFNPSAEGTAMISDPQTPRPFQGTLTGLRYHGRLHQLMASKRGVTITEEQRIPASMMGG